VVPALSSISTDVVLNSSETRRIWSSEDAVIPHSEWNDAEALIYLPYASTAEIVFRGVASVEDSLNLKSIAIRDFTKESVVGEVKFVRATGGMIYVEIETAESIPDPVLLRAYVKRLGSTESPSLRFTGKHIYALHFLQ
jgi:hypothetical protein